MLVPRCSFHKIFNQRTTSIHNAHFKQWHVYRFHSTSAVAPITIKLNKQVLTLDIRGVPRTYKHNFLKSRQSTQVEENSVPRVPSLVLEIPKYDALFLGIGRQETSLLSKYLDYREQKDKIDKPFTGVQLKRIQKTYAHVIPLLNGARAHSIPCISVGRDTFFESEAFAKAALQHKLELLNLFILYLQTGNILQDSRALSQFAKVSPNIFSAIVVQNATFILHRLHAELHGIKVNANIAKKNNLNLLVAVDEHIHDHVVKYAKEKLPILLNENAPQNVDILEQLQPKGLGNWCKFALYFLVAPTVALVVLVAYTIKCYSTRLLKDSRVNVIDIGAPIHKSRDDHSRD